MIDDTLKRVRGEALSVLESLFSNAGTDDKRRSALSAGLAPAHSLRGANPRGNALLAQTFRLFVLPAYNNFVQEHRDYHSNG
jgi:hypothetical protein